MQYKYNLRDSQIQFHTYVLLPLSLDASHIHIYISAIIFMLNKYPSKVADENEVKTGAFSHRALYAKIFDRVFISCV